MITLIIGTAIAYYTEYCVSRPMSVWISAPLGVILLVAIIYYMKYLINLFFKLLKL